MSCFNNSNNICNGCSFKIRNFGISDFSKVTFNGADRTLLNWNEISLPEILTIPDLKPDIENLDQIYADAKITCAKLIETPYAYTIYDRLGTAYEVAQALAAVTLAGAVDITDVIDTVNDILALALPVIPEVAILQEALVAVEDAFTVLDDAVTAATTALGAACIAAETIKTLMEGLIAALTALRTALLALNAAIAALVAATAALPIGAAVAAAAALAYAAVAVVQTAITTAITALNAVIALLGLTQYFAINSNEEDTCLSGRKIVIEGVLNQKIVYTGLVTEQSVHSACYSIPFSAYVIPYAKFEGLTFERDVEVISDITTCATTTINGFAFDPDEDLAVDLCEDFNVDVYIEDIFAFAMDPRTIFKNVTLFFKATPTGTC